MKSILTTILCVVFVSSVFAQTPAELQFKAQVTAATARLASDQSLIEGLYAQLVTAQTKLATVQGAMGQVQKDLSAAQAKCP